MRSKQAQELLDKSIKLKYGDEIPLFKGIYIIQERKLHDSGFRLMNVVGHTTFDKEISDFKYYLLSNGSDVVDFKPLFDNLIKGTYAMCDLHLDINANGLIHIWTNSKKSLRCEFLHTSNCMFEVVDDGINIY